MVLTYETLFEFNDEVAKSPFMEAELLCLKALIRDFPLGLAESNTVVLGLAQCSRFLAVES